jgi:hypothetical protein
MTITRAEMYDRVRQNLGGISEEDTPSTMIDPHFDRIYSFEIPNRSGGGALRGFLEFNTVDGTEDYDLDAQAALQSFAYYGVRSPIVLLAGLPIWYSTDPDHFWRVYSRAASNEAEPGAVLLDGRIAYFRPIPNAVYTVRFFVSRSRATFDSQLEDDLEAEVLIRGAAFYMATDLGMGNAKARNQEMFTYFMHQVVGSKYLSSAPGETYDRGF